MAVTKITGENFEKEVLQSKEPVLVAYVTEWAPQCKGLPSELELISLKYNNKLRVLTMDADEEGAFCSKHRINSIPSFQFVENNEIISWVGHGYTGQLACAVDKIMGPVVFKIEVKDGACAIRQKPRFGRF